MATVQRSQELFRRVRAVLLDHHEGEVSEMPPGDGQILVMYSRVRSLLEGVRVLLDARLPEEAIILGRELFTDSLHLMELAHRGDDRAALLLGMANRALTQIDNMEQQALALGMRSAEQVEAVLEQVKHQRKRIEDYRQRNSLGQFAKFPHEKQLATTLGRLGEYMDFELANLYVHEPVMAQSGRTIKAGDVVGIHLHNPDDEALVVAAAFAMVSVLHAHKAVASVLGWTEISPDEIDSLLAEVEGQFQQPDEHEQTQPGQGHRS
jgi:hypothetical protein